MSTTLSFVWVVTRATGSPAQMPHRTAPYGYAQRSVRPGKAAAGVAARCPAPRPSRGSGPVVAQLLQTGAGWQGRPGGLAVTLALVNLQTAPDGVRLYEGIVHDNLMPYAIPAIPVVEAVGVVDLLASAAAAAELVLLVLLGCQIVDLGLVSQQPVGQLGLLDQTGLAGGAEPRLVPAPLQVQLLVDLQLLLTPGEHPVHRLLVRHLVLLPVRRQDTTSCRSAGRSCPPSRAPVAYPAAR